MGRKKYNEEDKKATVSLSINPQLAKMLDEQSEKEGLSKSALIENVLEDKLDANGKYLYPSKYKEIEITIDASGGHIAKQESLATTLLCLFS